MSWWVVFKVPPTLGTNSYGYYDSSMTSAEFEYHTTLLDFDRSALTNTFDAFNAGNYSRVAWNDEKPNGQTSSSGAHSKGFIGLDIKNKTGFFFSHSIPKYPDFS